MILRSPFDRFRGGDARSVGLLNDVYLKKFAELDERPSVRAYTRLDTFARRDSGSHHWAHRSTDGQPWCSLPDRRSVEACDLDRPDAARALCLMTMCHDGFRREAAIRRLRECDEPLRLPFTLLRLNDWAVEVRQAARMLVRGLLTPDRIATTLQYTDLITHVSRGGRDDHAWLIESVRGQVRSARPAVMVALLPDLRPPVRRVIHRWLRSPANDSQRAEWTEIALVDPEFAIRVDAARHLDWLDPDTREIAVARLERDPSLVLRKLALYQRLGEPATARGAIERCLLDRSRSVRNTARFYAQRDHPDLDVGRVYREALSQGEPVRIAPTIDGLSIAGTSDDLTAIERHADHPRVAVREAVVTARCRLDQARRVDHAVRALSDDSPRISRTARRILVTEGVTSRRDGLRELAYRAERAHVRRNALIALATDSVWTCLGPLLEALAHDADETVRRTALQELRSLRLAAVYTQPTEAQRLSIADALAAANDALPIHLRQRVSMMLR